MPPLLQLSGQPFSVGPRRLLRRTQNYDIVEFHFCAYAWWMRRVAATARVIYSAHNVELDYALTEPGSKLRRRFAQQVGKLERHAVSVSDLVVTCTEFDGKRLAQLYGGLSNYAVISNGFDGGEISAVPKVNREQVRGSLGLRPEELAILFVGGRAAHNRRAVRFLEDELLPALKLPARLLIAGECARPRRSDRVLSLGRVETLSPLFTAADVAVNPIDSGSGSNVKIAEYLGAGLPVVTTAIGLRGYEAFAPLMTVAELNGFADAVQAKHPRSAPSPEVAQLSWTALGRQLYGRYADLLAQ
jgi:glycosyltransferase involved in cell wall biosynthesis